LVRDNNEVFEKTRVLLWLDKCLPNDKCKAYVSDWVRVGALVDLAQIWQRIP
jgi:hypothetical protein